MVLIVRFGAIELQLSVRRTGEYETDPSPGRSHIAHESADYKSNGLRCSGVEQGLKAWIDSVLGNIIGRSHVLRDRDFEVLEITIVKLNP